MDELRTEHATQLGELCEKLAAKDEEIAELVKTKDKEIAELENTQEEEIAELEITHSDDLDDLENTLRVQHNAALVQLRSEHATQLGYLNEIVLEKTEEIAELENTHSDDLDDLEARLRRERHTAMVLREKLAEKQEELDDCENKWETVLAEKEQDHEGELEQARLGHQQIIDKLVSRNRELGKQIERVKAQLERESQDLAALDNRRREDLSAQEGTHLETVKVMRSELSKELVELRAFIESRELELAGQIDELKARLAEERERGKVLGEEKTRLEERMKGFKEEMDSSLSAFEAFASRPLPGMRRDTKLQQAGEKKANADADAESFHGFPDVPDDQMEGVQVTRNSAYQDLYSDDSQDIYGNGDDDDRSQDSSGDYPDCVSEGHDSEDARSPEWHPASPTQGTPTPHGHTDTHCPGPWAPGSPASAPCPEATYTPTSPPLCPQNTYTPTSPPFTRAEDMTAPPQISYVYHPFYGYYQETAPNSTMPQNPEPAAREEEQAESDGDSSVTLDFEDVDEFDVSI
ncbi:hypothetical protein V8F06_012371 [Rhypophila decipiens]